MIKYIEKEYVSDKGALLSTHFISGFRSTRNTSGAAVFVVTVQSYGNLESLISGKLQESFSYVFEPPIDMYLAVEAYDDLYDIVLADPESHLFGGILQVVDYTQEQLVVAKENKWKQIKQYRLNDINSNMVTPYGTIQCSTEDRQNITDTVLLAQTLTSMGQPVAINWTMADNSVVVLDLTMIVNIGLLLGQKVQAAHANARAKRELIDAVVEGPNAFDELAAITW